MTNAEWGMTPQGVNVSTVQPRLLSSGGGNLDPERYWIAPNGTAWGQYSGSSGRRQPGAPFGLATAYAPGGADRCGMSGPRGATGAFPRGVATQPRCTRERGHDGGPHVQHSSGNRSQAVAEWGLSREIDLAGIGDIVQGASIFTAPIGQPAPVGPRRHSSGGGNLSPFRHYLLPDGTGWAQHTAASGNRPSGAPFPLPTRYNDYAARALRCYQTPPWDEGVSPGNTDRCTRPGGHDVPHVAHVGSDPSIAWSEWGLEPEAGDTIPPPSADVPTSTAPVLVTHTSWGAALPEGCTRYVDGWVHAPGAALEVPAGWHAEPGERCAARGQPTGSAHANNNYNCHRFRRHDGAHSAGISGGRTIAEWGMAPAMATPISTPPAPAEMPGFISIEALRRETRRLAEREGWCPQHHEPLRELGVEPLGVTYEGEVTVRIPIRYTRLAHMQYTQYDVKRELEVAISGAVRGSRASALSEALAVPVRERDRALVFQVEAARVGEMQNFHRVED